MEEFALSRNACRIPKRAPVTATQPSRKFPRIWWVGAPNRRSRISQRRGITFALIVHLRSVCQERSFFSRGTNATRLCTPRDRPPRQKHVINSSRFDHQAQKRRQQCALLGFSIARRRPEIGDMVGRWGETPRNIDDAEASDAFRSHTDIIVSVKRDCVLASGGNVGDSVNITCYEKPASGFLTPKNAVFMHMVNQV